MKEGLRKLGVLDPSFKLVTVRDLVREGFLERPLDGNHGELHPKGEDFVSHGVPFIVASDIHEGRVDYASCKFISPKQASALRKGFARNGDVLLTHKATIGRTAIVEYRGHPFIMLTPQVTYYRVRDGRRLNNRYLRYYFDDQFFQQVLRLWADAGATRAYLGITSQQALPVILPPITKQRKIAAILAAYDELIEANIRRIALLERLAEEIYREWFVRWRFPGHRQARFAKGVPSEWKIKRLGQVVEFCYGKALKEQDRVPGDYDVYGSSGIVGTHHEALVPTPGLIVGRKGNVGSVYLADRGFFPIDTVYFVRSQMPRSFLYFLLCSMNFLNNDAAVPGLNRAQAYSSQFFLPPDSLVNEFAGLTNPLFEMRATVAHENELLRATRDLLLPRLLSGKFSVETLDLHFPPGMAEEVQASDESDGCTARGDAAIASA